MPIWSEFKASSITCAADLLCNPYLDRNPVANADVKYVVCASPGHDGGIPSQEEFATLAEKCKASQ